VFPCCPVRGPTQSGLDGTCYHVPVMNQCSGDSELSGVAVTRLDITVADHPVLAPRSCGQ